MYNNYIKEVKCVKIQILNNRFVKIIAAILLFAIYVLIYLQAGAAYIENTWEAWKPDYEKADLTELLLKSELSDEDYELVYQQTGLTRLGVDPLLSDGNIGEILRIQDSFFSERDYFYNYFAPFTGQFEKSRGRYPNAPLSDGDIIFCPATFLSSSVLGHTAIVVDGKVGRIAEAYGFGSGFDTTLKASFFIYPAFVILRPKVDEDIKKQVAQYTKDELIGAEYDIFAGLFEEKAPDTLERTHCSHSVWYAYNKFGIDLDSNGGKIVTPTDILNSPYLEVVQVFGMDINGFR